MRHSPKAVAVALMVALLGAACSGSGDAATTTWAAAATTMVATDLAEAPGEFAGVDQDGAIRAVATDSQNVVAVLQTGRIIIYTATLEIEVDDVITAGEQAEAMIAGLGGILFGQETTTGLDPRSVLTIKVPPERFTEAVRFLSGIGRLTGQSISADDVTERVVDLESRITTSQASVERLRGFLEETTDLEDVASLERELLQRETDLEVLRGQLRTLQDQVALATIVLVLTEPAPDPAVELVETAYRGHDAGTRCPGTRELSVDEGDELTFCFEITNAGDTLLGEIEVSDRGLDARFEDLIVVEGDTTTPMVPGGRLILAFETEADPDAWTDPAIQVAAIDELGNPLRQQVVLSHFEVPSLRVAEDTSLPGFGDAMAAAWHALQWLGGVFVLVGGAALPFLWVPVLFVGGWWWLRRRRRPTDE